MIVRDWTAALDKVRREGCCRVCGASGGVKIDAAHVVGRRNDPRPRPGQPRRVRRVRADDIVPLCRPCHQAYDERRLDLLPFLSLEEQAAAVSIMGIESARRRISGTRRFA